MLFNRIKKIRPLWYLDYNKEDTKKMLSKDYGWQWYGGHHLENRICEPAILKRYIVCTICLTK